MATPYSPLDVRSPRLAGLALRAFVGLVENPVTGPVVAAQMIRQLGLARLRETVAEGSSLLATLPHPPEETADDVDPASLSGASPWTDIAAYAEAYRSGHSPESVAEKFLAHRDALGAFIAVQGDDLRRQAAASAQRHREGRALSRLDGVPIAIKDEVDMVPYPTTVGTNFLGRTPAAGDATTVARLRAAGALLLGKTNMHELGIGVTGINPHHGPARNPYDPSRVTGGSSSGSACAVAAGYCPAALGADGGGSIRIPAALCGVVGLKPTFGRVSEHGAAPLCWTVAHIGPIASTARDCATLYRLMAGPDPLDPGTAAQPAPHLRGLDRGWAGLRIGVYRPWFEHADPEVVARCDAALTTFRAAGATVVEVDLPELDLANLAHVVTIAVEMAASQRAWFAANRDRYALDTRLNLSLAGSLTSVDYVHAQRVRGRIVQHVESALSSVDLLATPATACVAPPIRPDALAGGESDMVTLSRIMRFAPLANLTGHPAISFPVGYSGEGLPIGLQLVGRPWCEHTLLRAAHAAEPLIERRAPGVAIRLL